MCFQSGTPGTLEGLTLDDVALNSFLLIDLSSPSSTTLGRERALSEQQTVQINTVKIVAVLEQVSSALHFGSIIC